jgi:hypothetical protein
MQFLAGIFALVSGVVCAVFAVLVKRAAARSKKPPPPDINVE